MVGDNLDKSGKNKNRSLARKMELAADTKCRKIKQKTKLGKSRKIFQFKMLDTQIQDWEKKSPKPASIKVRQKMRTNFHVWTQKDWGIKNDIANIGFFFLNQCLSI